MSVLRKYFNKAKQGSEKNEPKKPPAPAPPPEDVVPVIPASEEPLRKHGVHVMTKPIGPVCNLQCKYCFYLEKKTIFDQEKSCRMADDVLEAYTQRYIRACAGPEVTFAWQGGEPTLLGVDFFRRAVELQRKYADGRPIRNALQTNGVLLNDEWCEFLAEEKFLTGLSLDGPRQVHDRYRIKPDGSGSFDDVMRGLKLLQKHGAEFNTLTCVPRENATQGRDIYRFLRNCGVRYMQFIPIVERVPGPRALELGLDADVPPYLEERPHNQEVMSYTVIPEQYGKFLIDIFKYWMKKDIGKIFVNHFDMALAGWLGQEPSLCVYAKECGKALAMEHDGMVYSCDHFVYPEYCLGNVMNDSFDRMLQNPLQPNFGKSKRLDLPGDCKSCQFLAACNGGCLKHRFMTDSNGEPGLNYLCRGFKKFFTYADPYLAEMAELLRAGRPAADIKRSRL